MIAALLAAASFMADFPQAATVKVPGADRLKSASGFEAPAAGASAEEAARSFLSKYSADFGISARQQLIKLSAGKVTRFERRIDGHPVFDGDINVGLNDLQDAIISVNSADVPPEASGRMRLSKKSALEKACAPDDARAMRGWKAIAASLRPVWRVDAADKRTFVDADNGHLLLKVSLRNTGISSANARKTF
jgi:hypothetical protein